jgi:[ribosomal protein S18]-alanine N-acetyltransferase
LNFVALTQAELEAVLVIEAAAYRHPWTRGNFNDSLSAGHHIAVLVAGQEVIGYFVAMKGFEEVHLLNITVAPIHQGQGFAQLMLQALALWAKGQGALWLWLEVRPSNTAAIAAYVRHGFARVSVRKGYYPTNDSPAGLVDPTLREDAIVMSLKL